jgi:protein-S-isoprenylcysteine O-methyltransferase Ste14
LRETIFKYRGLVWGIFAAAILIFPVSFSARRAAASVPLLAAGQILRFWAAGFIPKYRTLTVGAPSLVTSGPYAWVRNPLYAGNGIMGLGWSVMAGPAWCAVFAAVYFALYRLVIIPLEERFLAERFGEEYERYRRSTPSVLPWPSNLREKAARGRGGFDGKKSWFMERHSLAMNVFVTAMLAVRLYLSY